VVGLVSIVKCPVELLNVMNCVILMVSNQSEQDICRSRIM